MNVILICVYILRVQTKDNRLNVFFVMVTLKCSNIFFILLLSLIKCNRIKPNKKGQVPHGHTPFKNMLSIKVVIYTLRSNRITLFYNILIIVLKQIGTYTFNKLE